MARDQKVAGYGTILNLLARIFVPDLEIEITPDCVCFQQGANTLLLRPFVVLDTSEDDPRVVAVGEERSETNWTIRVDIFDPKSKTVPPKRKYECLEAFFRYALLSLRGRTALLRPSVRVRGAEPLSEALSGYETTLLRQALLSACARECVFEYAL